MRRTIAWAATTATTATTTLLLVLATALPARAERQAAGYRLDPAWKAGQRYTFAWELYHDISTMTVMGNKTPYQAHARIKGKALVTILEADADGQVVAAEVAFDAWDRRVKDGPMQPREKVTAEELSGKTVRVAFSTDARSGRRAVKVTCDDKPVDDALAETVRAMFFSTLMPARPVRVGEKWRTEDVEVILGAGARGRARLELADVGPHDGRTLASVIVEGEATLPDRVTQFARFRGVISIDLADRSVATMALAGPGALEQPLAGGGGILRHEGLFTRRLDMTAEAPVATDDARKRPRAADAAEAAAPAKPTVYDDPAGYLTLTIPAGWRARQSGKVMVFTHPTIRAGMGYRVEPVAQWVGKDRKAPTAREVGQAMRDDMARDVDFEVQDAAERQVAGRDGYWITYRDKVRDLRMLAMITVVGDQAVTIFSTADPKHFDEVAPTLREMRNSLVVHVPPRPPAAKGAGAKPRQAGLDDW